MTQKLIESSEPKCVVQDGGGNPSKDLRYLSEEQVNQYWRDGYLTLQSICLKDEVDLWRKESQRLWQTENLCKTNMRLQWRENQKGELVADRIDPLLDLSEVFSELSIDSRFLSVIADLLGQEASLFKAKLISKWPGTHGYALHQDFNYWRFVDNLVPDQMLTVVIALDECNPESGGLELFPGMHQELIQSSREGELDIDESLIDLSTGVIAKMSAGDILIFHSLTPHRSAANLSKSNRECLFFSYMCGDSSALYQSYYAQRSSSWMRPWEINKT